MSCKSLPLLSPVQLALFFSVTTALLPSFLPFQSDAFSVAFIPVPLLSPVQAESVALTTILLPLLLPVQLALSFRARFTLSPLLLPCQSPFSKRKFLSASVLSPSGVSVGTLIFSPKLPCPVVSLYLTLLTYLAAEAAVRPSAICTCPSRFLLPLT